jgi:hypothetical protein
MTMCTREDRQLLDEIARTVDAGACAQKIDVYWRDLDRAKRTDPALAYWHLGMLVGIVLRLTGRSRVDP